MAQGPVHLRSLLLLFVHTANMNRVSWAYWRNTYWFVRILQQEVVQCGHAL